MTRRFDMVFLIPVNSLYILAINFIRNYYKYVPPAAWVVSVGIIYTMKNMYDFVTVHQKTFPKKVYVFIKHCK